MQWLRVMTNVFSTVLIAAWFPVQLSAQETVIAVTGVNVVDGLAGSVQSNQLVVIEGDRIRTVEANGAIPAGARVIDGRGKYVMPGLWDMHAHLRAPEAPKLMPLFIAHGVTGVRDMSSDCDGAGPVCAPEMRAWQAQIEAGELLGPRLLALSSFAVNPPWDFEVTEDRARALVRRLAARGVDFVKIYYRLSPAAFRWILDEARQANLAVGGHIPLRVTAEDASNAGLRSLEHARDFLYDCFPGAAAFRAEARSQNPPVDVMRSMVDDHDATSCDAIFRTFVRNDTWYVPTHVTRRMDAFADDSAFRNDPRRRHIPAALWRAWQADADRMVALDPTPEGRRVMRGFYTRGLEITGRAHAAGVPIVLGTDAGDTYVFFGSSVHDELGELVKAGLTPAQALAAATARSAEFLGLQADYGAVAQGKRADLVILNANPLEDIANTRRIEAVIFGGRVFDRSALDRMLRETEDAVNAMDRGN